MGSLSDLLVVTKTEYSIAKAVPLKDSITAQYVRDLTDPDFSPCPLTTA